MGWGGGEGEWVYRLQDSLVLAPQRAEGCRWCRVEGERGGGGSGGSCPQINSEHGCAM